MLLPPASPSPSASQSPSVSPSGSLEQLTLAMSSISDLSLTRLAHTYSHSLQTLSLEWCAHISDVGVAVLMSQCSLLTSLSLKACKSLSDASALAIGRGACCSSLGEHSYSCMGRWGC